MAMENKGAIFSSETENKWRKDKNTVQSTCKYIAEQYQRQHMPKRNYSKWFNLFWRFFILHFGGAHGIIAEPCKWHFSNILFLLWMLFFWTQVRCK